MTNTGYTKPYYSVPDQLNLLMTRGLQVADQSEAIRCLQSNGYYRLSAYWYSFRRIEFDPSLKKDVRTDQFLDNSHFEDALQLYAFDKKLKLLLLDAIEQVEIAVRVEIALLLGSIDPFAYLNPRLFHTRFGNISPSGLSYYDEWIAKFNAMVRRSKETFVIHHKDKYGDHAPLPIWIAIELWDFGLLSYLYSNMQQADRNAVAAKFGINEWGLMASWLKSLNYVRNVIAHHGRLWNLNIAEIPQLPKVGTIPEFDSLLRTPNSNNRVYFSCCILAHYSRKINPKTLWTKQFAELIKQFPVMPHANIHHMGIPAKWEQSAFWH